jgi:hypothetical protein
MAVSGRLYPAQEKEHNQNYNYHAEPATGIVTPTAAIGPSWSRGETQNDEQDYKKKHNQNLLFHQEATSTPL